MANTTFTLTLDEPTQQVLINALESYRQDMQDRWPNEPDPSADRASDILAQIKEIQDTLG